MIGNFFSFFLLLLSIFPMLAKATDNFEKLIEDARYRMNLLEWHSNDAEIQKREEAKQREYFTSEEHLKKFLKENYQMWPDSSGSTEDNKRYLTCTKIKPTNMTDRELILKDDYKVDVILSLSKLRVVTESNSFFLYSEYFFSSKGIDVYKDLGRVAFIDKSKNLNIIYFNGTSLSVEIENYKCEDPGMVKLLKMKAKY